MGRTRCYGPRFKRFCKKKKIILDRERLDYMHKHMPHWAYCMREILNSFFLYALPWNKALRLGPAIQTKKKKAYDIRSAVHKNLFFLANTWTISFAGLRFEPYCKTVSWQLLFPYPTNSKKKFEFFLGLGFAKRSKSKEVVIYNIIRTVQ